MSKRILFVDDEPMILQGLQRMLRPMRDDWDMAFIDSGEKALAAMAERAFDVVVTDMRMPGMNGAQLLKEIQHRYPMTIRLILSGHADADLVNQCLGVAHQYIAKPCDPALLKVLIGEACQVGESRITDKVKVLLGSIDNLPSTPKVFVELERALADPDTSTQHLGCIIQQDMGMTAKILKIVNSAFFGLRRTISNPMEAVAYLGIDTVKALVLVNSIFERAKPLGTRSVSLEDLWRHSLVTATGAKTIAIAQGCNQAAQDETFVGGILEDVGILVLASSFPKAYDQVAEAVSADKAPLTVAEEEAFTVNHAEVGAYLLSLWSIPGPVVRIVHLHHSPQRIKEPGFNPALAVYAADILVGERGGNPLFRTGRFDLTTLARLGLADRIEPWRLATHELPGELEGTPNG